MSAGVLRLSLLITALAVFAVAMTTSVRPAAAYPGDICEMITWDSTGTVLNDGDVVGGNGMVYLLYRVEDDAFGYLDDFLASEEVQSLLAPLYESIDDLNDELDDLVNSGDWIALNLPAYDENTTSGEIADDIQDIEDEDGFDDPLDPNYEDLHDAYDLLNEAYQIVVEKESYQEVIDEILAILDDLGDVDLVRIDSQTGSAFITSQAEVIGFDFVTPAVGHIVKSGALSQYVDHMFPNLFNGPDGEEINSISDWLAGVVGIPVPSAVSNAANVCGTSAADGWAFVDITCREFGTFNIDVIPDWQVFQSEITRGTRAGLICPGVVDTATISASPTTLEVQPVGTSSHTSTITVTVKDQDGDEFDGAPVQFLTNSCTFANPNAGKAGDLGMSPAEGGSTVTLYSDTDSAADAKFLIDNPGHTMAGTAEVALVCSSGTPGEVTVTAIVDRPGADIVLTQKITLVGTTAASGLVLTLTPDSLECGEVLIATATAVDVNGVPVSDGTRIYFTTDTSSGIIGGQEGGQGSNTTIGGETTVTIAVSPNDGGTHTVIAYTLNSSGALLSQTAELFECTAAVGAAAPTVAPPSTGTGTGSITPPNTGDAGLVGASGSGFSYVLAGAVTVFALFVGWTANRVCFDGRRR